VWRREERARSFAKEVTPKSGKTRVDFPDTQVQEGHFRACLKSLSTGFFIQKTQR
jgi:hypothetical protein